MFSCKILTHELGSSPRSKATWWEASQSFLSQMWVGSEKKWNSIFLFFHLAELLYIQTAGLHHSHVHRGDTHMQHIWKIHTSYSKKPHRGYMSTFNYSYCGGTCKPPLMAFLWIIYYHFNFRVFMKTNSVWTIQPSKMSRNIKLSLEWKPRRQAV